MSRPPLHRWRTTLALAAMPLALLVGCSDDAPTPVMPDETSAAPTSPTETTPSEPVEPTPPPEMEGKDAEAAEAFVEYYFDVLSYAIASGDTRAVKALALKDCASCRGAVVAIEQIYASDGTVRGGRMVATGTRAKASDELVEGVRPFDAISTLAVSEQTIRGTGDKSLDGTSQPSKVAVQAEVIRSPRGWIMAEWRQTS